MPTDHQAQEIERVTVRLPLLIETVLALRRSCGTYEEALEFFADRGGDDARRYLYQREYDRLLPDGKARQILAAFFLVEEPIGFSAFANLFQFAPEQVRDALTECHSIFLSTFENEKGATLYQISPPAIPFIRHVSEQLSYFQSLAARVRHFRSEGKDVTVEEAALIVTMNRMIRLRNFDGIIELEAESSLRDQGQAALNPKVQALIGQAYTELGPEHREAARKCFRHSEGLGYTDTYMMRRWYNMELFSGYGLEEAERICNVVLSSRKSEGREKLEFTCKLAACYFARSKTFSGANREKELAFLKQSICCYMDGLHLGSKQGVELSDNLAWMERPLHRFIKLIGADIDQYFSLLEALVERDHDIEVSGMEMVLMVLARSPLPADAGTKRAVKNFCNRTVGKISKKYRSLDAVPGVKHLQDTLSLFRRQLDAQSSLRTN